MARRKMYAIDTCEAQMTNVLIGYEDLKQRGIKLSPRQLHRKVLAGTFPKPIKIGEQTKAWIADEIDAWIDAKKAERNESPSAPVRPTTDSIPGPG